MSNTEETRTEFHQLMDEVRGDLVRMSGLVTEGISTVTQALLGNDTVSYTHLRAHET